MSEFNHRALFIAGRASEAPPATMPDDDAQASYPAYNANATL
ncbi:hypothetical protein HMPREF0208_01425 [Citrobacter koseri]|nr:hypothetical protein HMPREF3207_04179 [Citrobacter koseri]KXA00499.1 hypothetical protein HMPREF3220_01872 [Citrobacter koseri]KXB45349.1 hypothetical protein HMPREF0208_01425 [Citrobacter koseri]